MSIQDAPTEDTNTRTAQLVQLITEIGPDIPEISRRLGQFKESVRYRYKEKVLGRGFGVQAIIDHTKLGLKRVLMTVELGSEFKPFANSILAAMNELCYVVYFEKRMLTDDYIVAASVPTEFLAEYEAFMKGMKTTGLFKSIEVVSFDWFRNNAMRTECYDFDTGRWDFDWSSPLKTTSEAAYAPGTRDKFDYLDLLILKEMQMDATRSFVEISEKLKVNYKVLDWHYKSHVLGRGLISGYYLRWMGTTYSTTLEKALHRQHRYQHIAILVRGLLDGERMEVMAGAHSVPFLWSEMVGAVDYYAEFYFPTEDIVGAFQFLTKLMAPIKERASVMILDQTEALSFTISYKLFDKEMKQWTFDARKLTAQFEKVARQIKETGGSYA